MKNSFYILVLLFLFNTSCKSTEPVSENKTQKEFFVDNTPNPEIIMLFFFINEKDSVSLIDSFSNYGVYKGIEDHSQMAYDGDIKLTFLDGNGSICHQKIVANPLTKKVEYSNEDASGKIFAETVDLKEATFFVRLQWEDCLHHIKVEKLDEDNWRTLVSFDLTKPSIK